MRPSRIGRIARLVALAGAATLGAAAGVGSGPAWAESEQAVSVGLGWATFSAPGEVMEDREPEALAPTVGGNVFVTYERHIGTDLALRAEVVGGLFYGGADEKKMQSQTATALVVDAGAALRFDVLKYVPYAFVGIGVLTAGGGPLERTVDPAIVVGGGLDWLQSRARSYGLEARLASFGGDVSVVTIGLRGTVRWGYF